MDTDTEHGTGPDADAAARAALVEKISDLRQQLRSAIAALAALDRYNVLEPPTHE